MARQLIACEAKCRSCRETFSHPGISDSSYGEIVLSSPDGRSYILASAFGWFPERVRSALSSNEPRRLWKALAALADHGPSGPFTTTMHCPNCHSADLEYWNGREVGIALVPDAEYSEYEDLDDGELARQLALLT
jgi:Zn finger protein HypA/HybF involved in hydrogenase expression